MVKKKILCAQHGTIILSTIIILIIILLPITSHSGHNFSLQDPAKTDGLGTDNMTVARRTDVGARWGEGWGKLDVDAPGVIWCFLRMGGPQVTIGFNTKLV